MSNARERRAVVFDLDDTLHRERRFILSGFAAVAIVCERRWGVPRAVCFRLMAGALRRGDRARALQTLCGALGVPESVIPELVDIVRRHVPSLRLPRESATVLGLLRPRWRLGILTNGVPSVQAAKVAALGLERLVDSVVMAEAVVPGGKPATEAFAEVLKRLDVAAARTWFVGNDVDKDVTGARSAGLRAVWLRRAPVDSCRLRSSDVADAVIADLRELPAVLERATRVGVVA